MAYLVTKRINNGYHCCCHQSWEEDADWIQDRAEALAKVPTLHPGISDGELEEITVTDGQTTEVIAYGKLEWAPRRIDCYRLWHWSGCVDGKPFDQVVGGQPGESWSDLIARRDRELRASSSKLPKPKSNDYVKSTWNLDISHACVLFIKHARHVEVPLVIRRAFVFV